MSNYDNTGILFKNDVRDNPKRPAYKGNIEINGTKHEIAGWVRQGKNGEFISLKVDTKTAAKKVNDDQEIPF